ncbi:Transposable element Tcb2 transposase, partial [Stegodyphus mimosarum]
MVWAGIMLDGRTPFHVFDRGSVTGVRYRDEVWEPCVRFFQSAVGPEFILHDDNARPHTALLVDEFLESEDIRRVDWLARATGRLEARQSQTEVARWLNMSPSVVHRLWKQFQTTDSESRRFSRGRPTATTNADDRYLTLCARRNPTATQILFRSSLAAATGRLVSTSTVLRRLHEGCVYARRPAICVPLTLRHRRDRSQWARQHVHWRSDQWRVVLFTDESRFSLKSDSRGYLICREPRTRYYPSNIRKRDAYGRGSVCVWGGISLRGRTDLHVFPRGTLNAQVF